MAADHTTACAQLVHLRLQKREWQDPTAQSNQWVASSHLPGSCICAGDVCRLNETERFHDKGFMASTSSLPGPDMKIKLVPDLTEKVMSLTNDYGYAPDEVISIGIALATVLLEERRLGNRVVVITPNGDTVAEFKEAEPKAIHEIAKEYIQSICPEAADMSAALLVARLERERDLEERRR
jgi:hypothetical protein